ncbi:MAG: STAS domain-containing protein [Pseudomonadota bacterium]
MQIIITQSENSARITVSGEIDEHGAEEFKRRFAEVRLTANITVAFDFSGVTHIGSAGLGKLLLFYKSVASHGGVIRIERVSPAIYDLLAQLKLDTIFTISRQ